VEYFPFCKGIFGDVVSISDRLRSVIGTAKIDEFAELIGEPPQRVKDVLRNKQRPPMDMLVKLRTIQGVDLNWFAVGEGAAGPVLDAQEASLLVRYRQLSPTSQEALRSMANALQMQVHHQPVNEAGREPARSMTFNNSVGQVIQGDAHVGKQTFHATESPVSAKQPKGSKPHK
jgi:hypothetical protein